MNDDEVLIERLKHGDQAALECIYVKYRPKLMATARSYLADRHQAEDVLHDVFLSFTDISRDLNINHSLYAYLRAGILNGIKDIMRKRSRQKNVWANRAIWEDPLDCPHNQLVALEETIQAEGLLRGLPDSQREVVCMRIQGGLKFREIACMQGVSCNTVRGRYRHGICRLRGIVGLDRMD